MLGVDKKIYKESENDIKDGTYIIDLDTPRGKGKIFMRYYKSVMVNRLGTTKGQGSEDLPSLPSQRYKILVENLSKIIRSKDNKKKLSPSETPVAHGTLSES